MGEKASAELTFGLDLETDEVTFSARQVQGKGETDTLRNPG